MKQDLWIVSASVSRATLGFAQSAAELAGERSLEACAVILGERPGEAMESELGALGIKRIYSLGLDIRDVNCQREAVVTLARLIQERGPVAVLFEYSDLTGAVAPAVAAKLGLGITADCTELKWSDDYGLLQIRPTFGGRLLAVNRSVSRPYIATVRKGIYPLRPQTLSAGRAELIQVPRQEESPLFRLLERIEDNSDSERSLTDARLVLSGGMGLGGREGFRKLERLARLTGAAVGASRAAVAAGYASYAHQVGQTGLSVTPRLYVAFGISGAVQHLSGIIGAEKIIAVNSDPKAPIHDFCDFSLLSDCGAVIDMLLDRLQ